MAGVAVAEYQQLLSVFAESPGELLPEHVENLLYAAIDSIEAGFHIEHDEFIDWLLGFQLLPITRRMLEDAKF